MNSPDINDKIDYRIPLFLTLIAAGLAGNYYCLTIFLNIEFLFGSIFALLALQFFGLGGGLIASSLIASATYLLWDHPYAIIIGIAEVAIVSWLMNRRKLGMVLADMLYWLFIGMPLIYLFYHLAMDVALPNTAIHMTKQAINGIANALVARLIFTVFILQSRTALLSFSEIAYNLLAFFVLYPTLMILAVGSRTDFNETDHRIRGVLQQDSERAAQRLETWVANRKSAILNLAEMAASRSAQQMQPYLEQAKKSDTNFQRVGLTDQGATTTAIFPLIDEQGKSSIGVNFADRPHIPQLKRTLKPMLSEVVVGKIGPPKPMVLMLAPVLIRGEYGGYAFGRLRLEQIQEYLNKSVLRHESLYTLKDKNGNVIMTNRSDQKVMTPFERSQGEIHQLDQKISQWIPTLPPHTPRSEHWQQSIYIAEIAIGDLAEWTLILEQPVAPFQKRLYDKYTGNLILLLLILLTGLTLAELLSRRAVMTLKQLSVLTHDLPARLTTDSNNIPWPKSGIKETQHLINNFKVMTNSLADKFSEIKEINESLEERIDERTKSLEAANSALTREISDHKLTLRQLSEAKTSAETANIAKSAFLANMSHEIRTPMNGVIGLIELLLGSDLTEEQRKYAELVKLSGRNLVELISDILDLSKIEAHKMELDSQNFDLQRETNGVIKLLSLRAEEKGLALSMQIDNDVPLRLKGDAGRLRQILTNIIGNAIKFTDKGSVALHICKDAEDEERTILRFLVRDTGIGIASDKLEKVFDRFTQADNSPTRTYGGTGLGLTISRQLAELMGGTIGVESMEGRGTTFWFTVILTKQTGTDLLLPLQEEVQGNKSPSHSPDSIHLLLAEDDPTNQVMTKLLLTRAGYLVDVASNGREVLKLLEENDYDLVLMDCMMPVMNGYDTTSVIRNPASYVRNHAIPVIALTANAMQEDRKRCLAAGMNDYLAKPIEVMKVIEMLEKWLPVDVEPVTTRENDTEPGTTPIPVFDRSAFVKRTLGDLEISRGVATLFIDNGQEYIESISSALALKDAAALRRSAHKLKGAAATMELPQLAKTASLIEVFAEERNLEKSARLFPILKKQYDKALEALQEHLHNPFCE